MPTRRTPTRSNAGNEQSAANFSAAGSSRTPRTSGYGSVTPIQTGRHASLKKKTPKGCFIALIVVIILIVVAGVVVYNWYSSTFSTESTTEQIEENATAEVTYDLPQALDMAGTTYESLIQYMDSLGVTYYDNTDDETKASSGASIIKLPDGVDLATAAAWYAQGVENLSTANAVRFLNGSWTISLTVDTEYDCRLRFALFGAGGESAAVTNVQSSVGLADATVTAEGTDSSGNTYVEGTFDKDGETYNFRIAACPLSDVYSVEDLPSDSTYVVVTVSQ